MKNLNDAIQIAVSWIEKSPEKFFCVECESCTTEPVWANGYDKPYCQKCVQSLIAAKELSICPCCEELCICDMMVEIDETADEICSECEENMGASCVSKEYYTKANLGLE